jgi:hypothetical protein
MKLAKIAHIIITMSITRPIIASLFFLYLRQIDLNWLLLLGLALLLINRSAIAITF